MRHLSQHLALIRHAGAHPQVVEYLKTPPSRKRLVELIAASGLTVREVLREKGTAYQELGLGNPELTDGELLDAMLDHPILINRPFVETPMGVRMCRPSEFALEILPPLATPFVKEDGEVLSTVPTWADERTIRGCDKPAEETPRA